MGNKYRFEKREVLAAILGALLIPAVAQILSHISSLSLTFERIGNYIVFEAIIVAIIAGVTGPISGVIAGIGGYILEGLLLKNDISIALLLELSFIGYFVGIYYEKISMDDENYMKERLIDFNLTQLISIIVGNVIFMPLAEFFQNGRNIFYMIVRGAKQCVLTCILLAVLGSAAMYIRYIEAMKRKSRIDIETSEKMKEEKDNSVEGVSEAAQILDAYN